MDSGLYVLLLHLTSSQRISIGALGEHHFKRGWYLYTGSARRNLRRRVARHLSSEKALRWHIDYLTTATVPVGALLVFDEELHECELNQMVGAEFQLMTPMSRFGASDCHKGCPAHLWYSPKSISPKKLKSLDLKSFHWLKP